jgi:siderophore synthetase component
VHPWQLERKLPKELAAELESGVCVPLGVSLGAYTATSSVRSLETKEQGLHVKLPLGVVSLGAVRSLPALYLTNGDRGQQLLHKLRAADEVLRDKLHLCDEALWWAYMPRQGEWFADGPRHLSCQLRRYPSAVFGDPSCQLVPMSALSVYEPSTNSHLFDSWLQQRGLRSEDNNAILRLFREICSEYLYICLRMVRFGALPEIHGQNVILVLREGQVDGLVLRDHDTVRIHLPWLKRAGIEDPAYIVKPDRSNSLYNDTPEALLVYLQTLGIQVNLYAIAESLRKRYRFDERQLWQEIQACLDLAVENSGLPSADKSLIHRELFESRQWPWKQLIAPLLRQQGSPGGSMPSGMGKAPNPFVHSNDGPINL